MSLLKVERYFLQGAGGGKREEKVAYKLLLTQSFISKDPRSSLGH